VQRAPGKSISNDNAGTALTYYGFGGTLSNPANLSSPTTVDGKLRTTILDLAACPAFFAPPTDYEFCAG
jgi:hypothetical protein